MVPMAGISTVEEEGIATGATGVTDEEVEMEVVMG